LSGVFGRVDKSLHVSRQILMIPGPTELHPRVVEALAKPIYPHYGEEWKIIYNEAVEHLRKIFSINGGETHIVHGPGTLALEMGVVNLVERGDEVVALVNGFFSSRLAEVAENCGAKVRVLEAERGDVVPPQRLKALLDNSRGVKLLLITHNETSTATLSPIGEYAKIAKKHNVLVLVDAISSLGGAEIGFDENKLDCCVGSANKCLNSIPGAAPIAFSDEALETIAKRKTKPQSWYTNMDVWRKYIRMWGSVGHPYPATVNTYAILALREAAAAAIEEGLQKRYARHLRVARAVRRALESMGFRIIPKEEVASPTVSSALVPDEIAGRAGELLSIVKRDYGIVLGSGVDNNDKDVVRIGHMGISASLQYLAPTISAISLALERMGVKCRDGLSVLSEELNRR